MDSKIMTMAQSLRMTDTRRQRSRMIILLSRTRDGVSLPGKYGNFN